ncbi:hypothetical protein J6590_008764 [Homalodisca vitripennis]|nr:hypothetical protein J6590_008764 [Homalodisca vitripennis]
MAENKLDVCIVDSGEMKRKYEDEIFGSQTYTKRQALELNKTVHAISIVENKKSAEVTYTQSKKKTQVSKKAKNFKHKAVTALSTLKTPTYGMKPCSVIIEPIDIDQLGYKSSPKLSKVTNAEKKSINVHNTTFSSNHRQKILSVVNTKNKPSNKLIKALKSVDSTVSDEKLDSSVTPMNRVITTKDFINANILNLGNKGGRYNVNEINKKQHVSKQMNNKSTNKNISSKIQTGSINTKTPLFEELTVTDFIEMNSSKLSQQFYSPHTNSTLKESRLSTFKPSKNSDQVNISHSKEPPSVQTDSQISECLIDESVSTNEGINLKGNGSQIIVNTNIIATNLNSTSNCSHRQPNFTPNDVGVPELSNCKSLTITDKSNKSQNPTELPENDLIVPNLLSFSNSPNLTVSVYSSGQQLVHLNTSLLPNQMNSLKVQTNLEKVFKKNLIQILQKPDSMSSITRNNRNNVQTQTFNSRNIKQVVQQVNQQKSPTNCGIWLRSNKKSEEKNTSQIQLFSSEDKTLSSSHCVSISEKHTASTISCTLSQSQSVSLTSNLSSDLQTLGGTTINNTMKPLTNDQIANCDLEHKLGHVCFRKKNKDLEEILDGTPPFIQEVFKCDNIRDGFNNADLVFVLSLLPDIEEMTDAQKRTFQVMVIESLKSVFGETQ